jgi:hypothetical protein
MCLKCLFRFHVSKADTFARHLKRLPLGVRFGSKADVCGAKCHVRFMKSASAPAPGLALLEKGVEKRLGWLAMTGKDN